MVANLHSSLAGAVSQTLQHLPASVVAVLDAWSARVARRRAQQRQQRWMQQKLAPAPVPVKAVEPDHLKPWRD